MPRQIVRLLKSIYIPKPFTKGHAIAMAYGVCIGGCGWDSRRGYGRGAILVGDIVGHSRGYGGRRIPCPTTGAKKKYEIKSADTRKKRRSQSDTR